MTKLFILIQMIIYNKYYRGMVIKVVIIGYSKSLKLYFDNSQFNFE